MSSPFNDFVTSASEPTAEAFATTCNECGLVYHWKAFAPAMPPKHLCVLALRRHVETLEARLNRLEEIALRSK